MKHVTQTGKDLWTMATYTCIRNEEGEVERILFLGVDSTEQRKLNLDMEGVVDAVNHVSLKIIFDINGNIKEYNEPFLHLFSYSEEEVEKLSVFELIDTLELDLFNKKWENVVRGMNFQGQFKVKTKNEEERWIRGAFNTINNMYGDIEKVIYIGNDITNEKMMEIESKKQNETIKEQEKILHESEKLLNQKLKEVKLELREQFKETEIIKVRNEIILEEALDSIIITSRDNNILFYNDSSIDLFGYTKEEVIGKNISILFDEKTIKNDEFLTKYTSLGDEKIIRERKKVKIRRKNGSETPVLILLIKAEVDNEITYTAFIQSNN